jgi:hypothetical protein
VERTIPSEFQNVIYCIICIIFILYDVLYDIISCEIYKGYVMCDI